MNDSLIEIKEALRKNPDNPLALRTLAQYYLREGLYKEAQNHYLQAISNAPHIFADVLLDFENEICREPSKIGPRFILAGIEINHGDIDAALLELEESLEVDPKNVEAYNVLGRIYVKQGRIDETIALLEKSLGQGVKDVSLIEILAAAYLEKGRIQEAIKFYRELLNYRPADKQILRILGELYTRVEDFNQAALNYQAMFSDDPQVSQEIIQRLEELLKKREGNIFIREILADVYMKSIKPDKAVVKLQEIMRLDAAKLEGVVAKLKEILRVYPGHAQVFLVLAEALRRQGQFSESVENYHSLVQHNPELLAEVMAGYQKVLEFCPQQVLARNYLAEAYLYKNQIEAALLEYENILKVDPSSANAVIEKCREIIKTNPRQLLAHLVLGRAYLVKGDDQRAVNEAEGIIALDKKFTPAYLLLGEAYFKLRLCRKAVNILHTALSMDPYNLEIQEKFREAKERELNLEIEAIKEKLSEDIWKISLHLDLAKIYIQLGQREEAVRELQLSLKDQSRAPFAYDLLGRIHRAEGRYDLAQEQFNKALELTPAEIPDFMRSVRFNLATTHEARGEIKEAIKIYEGILQEDIDFGKLKRRVKHLKATSLQSIRNKPLVLVTTEYQRGKVIAFWGREIKSGYGGRKEDVRVSFGQGYNSSGFDFFMKGMYKAALEEFQLATQLDAKFAAALNNLGVTLAKEGRYSEAKVKLEEAVQLDPNSVIFHNNLGVVCLLLGQIDQAKIELSKAYTIDPELIPVCVNLGDISYFKKDVKRALDLYKRAGEYSILAEIAGQRLAFKTP